MQLRYSLTLVRVACMFSHLIFTAPCWYWNMKIFIPFIWLHDFYPAQPKQTTSACFLLISFAEYRPLKRFWWNLLNNWYQNWFKINSGSQSWYELFCACSIEQICSICRHPALFFLTEACDRKRFEEYWMNAMSVETISSISITFPGFIPIS